MKEERIPCRQQLATAFCGLLAPLIRVVPGITAEFGGQGAWVGPLLALPVILIMVFLLAGVFRRLPEGTTLAGCYRLAWGRWLGGGAALLTVLWMAVTAAVNLRFYAERFVSSIYQDTDLWVFLVLLGGLAWQVSRHGMGAVCRMGTVFGYGLLFIIGLVLILGARDVSLTRVWPVWLNGTKGLAGSAWPVTAILGYSIPMLFQQGGRSWEREETNRTGRWLILLCLMLTLIGLVILGMFGWQMTVRLQNPFFTLGKEVGTLYVAERLESVVAAVWLFSDLALFTVFMNSGVSLIRETTGRGDENILRGIGTVLCVVGAVYIRGDAFSLRLICEHILLPADAAVCYGVPLAAALTLLIKGRI